MNKTNRATSFLLLLALLLAVVLLALPARAATITWDGALPSDDWDAAILYAVSTRLKG